MSELAMTLLRLSYLALLWFFVFAAVAVLRRDLFSTTRVTRRKQPGGKPAPSKPRGRALRNKPSDDATSAIAPIAPTPAAPSAASAENVRRSTKGPGRLRVLQGKLSGTSISLGSSSIEVGRSAASTIVLDDDYASARHARFYQSGDTWFVEDLGSTNGTIVNGKKISEPTALGLGSTVQIGGTVMELTR